MTDRLTEYAGREPYPWSAGQRPLTHAVLIVMGTAEDRRRAARHMACAIASPDGTLGPNGADILDGVHEDVREVGLSQNAQSVKIDEVRFLRSEAYLAPVRAKKRVFILADANRMTVQAQNALLKVLEEPPDDTAFLLLAPDKNGLLPTVLSRVTVYSLKERPSKDAAQAIARETGLDALCARRFAAFLAADSGGAGDQDTAATFQRASEACARFYSGQEKDAVLSFPKEREAFGFYCRVFAYGARDLLAARLGFARGFALFDPPLDGSDRLSPNQLTALEQAFEDAFFRILAYGNQNAVWAVLMSRVEKALRISAH